MKIGIVGPRESKWTQEQAKNAKVFIHHILANAELGTILKWSGIVEFEDNLIASSGRFYQSMKVSDITIVSGHCPVGEERWYSPDEGKFVEIEPGDIIFPDAIKVYDKGGVDTWVEMETAKLELQTEIYPAICTMLGTSYEYCKDYQQREGGNHDFWNLHFKPRNIQIAEAFDIGYCIVPYNPTKFCKHHKVYGHPSNGGCWTIRYGMKLGKEVHLVVIK